MLSGHWPSRGLCLIALVSGLSPSCSQGPVTVEGQVTLDGAPLGNVYVSLFPEETGRSTTVTVDADGKFVTKLWPGNYKVAVIAKRGEAAPSDDNPAATPPASAPIKKRHWPFPVRYAEEGKSGLTCNVPPSGAKVTLALQSK